MGNLRYSCGGWDYNLCISLLDYTSEQLIVFLSALLLAEFLSVIDHYPPGGESDNIGC